MRIKDGFYLTEIGTDYVVIASTPEAKKLFGGMLRLNTTGAFLWNKLVEGATEDQLAEALSAEYSVSQSVAVVDTADFISTIRQAGFIEE